MRQSIESAVLLKVHYRPIEAAIRWSGLLQYESQIIGALGTRTLPGPSEFPAWPTLRLNTERIYDGIVNNELPWAVDGKTVHEQPTLERPDLTVRHVDLKTWMIRYYPEQRPAFLFEAERCTDHLPIAALDVLQVLLAERDSFKTIAGHELAALQVQTNGRTGRQRRAIGHQQHDEAMSARAETTYLHIIGALVDVMLGHAPSGQAYSRFTTQESIVSVMLAHHGQRLGISERTLHAKFAAARRRLTD